MAAPVAADSSVIVAALVAWHESHEVAAAALEAALARRALVIPLPALFDAYALLTSLPAQHRLAPADAYHLLRTSLGSARIAGLKTRESWSLLRRWSVAGVGGADAADGAVLEAARDAGAKTLLTFRRRELERVAAGIELVEPV